MTSLVVARNLPEGTLERTFPAQEDAVPRSIVGRRACWQRRLRSSRRVCLTCIWTSPLTVWSSTTRTGTWQNVWNFENFDPTKGIAPREGRARPDLALGTTAGPRLVVTVGENPIIGRGQAAYRLEFRGGSYEQ